MNITIRKYYDVEVAESSGSPMDEKLVVMAGDHANSTVDIKDKDRWMASYCDFLAGARAARSMYTEQLAAHVHEVDSLLGINRQLGELVAELKQQQGNDNSPM